MSETVTTTLTEFLLARIAEDEERVQVATGINWDGRPSFYETEGAHRDDWNLWTFHVRPERVLAECEAKRRIVEAYIDAYGQNRDTLWGRETRVGITVAVDALASVYADHPDCRDEWKP